METNADGLGSSLLLLAHSFQEQPHWCALESNVLDFVLNLVFKVPQTQGGMDEAQHDGQSDENQEGGRAFEKGHQEIRRTEDGKETRAGVIPPEASHGGLVLSCPHESSKQQAYEEAA
uniref:Uncharacterized protein n=1 Tax=Micrurus spixii TaxID=129469 RepID=A0A2D4LU08_9SAUR